MKPKTLIPLVVILAVLGGLVLFRQSQHKPVSITEQVKLRELLPADLKPDDVDRIELYAGSLPEEKVVIARAGDDDEAWIVTSHFNAPVQSDKITKYLDALTGLKGEFRATAPDTEALTSYELDDITGFHIVGKKGDGDEELFHVLVGKSPKYGNSFMRAETENDVFVTDVNLRQQAGLYSENMEDPPTASTWLDKQIAKIDKDGVQSLALKMPDKTIGFEWQKTEFADAEVEGEGEGEPELGPEFEWVVTEGGYKGELKTAGLEAILTKLANLTGTDIVDPTKKDEWHLDPPGYVVTAKLDGQDEPVIIEGGRDPSEPDGYMRVASNDKDVVYKINKYNFEQVFPKASTLFTLPSISASSTDVTEMEYTFDGHSVKIAKDGDDWKIVEPASDLAMVKSKPTSIAAALANWRAEDYADAGTETGLASPDRFIGFKLADGATHTIEIGAPSTSIDGNYVRLDGGAEILTMAAIDSRKVFVEPKDLYDRTLLPDLFASDIATIEIFPGDEGGAYTLQNADGTWKLLAGEGELEADQSKIDDLLDAITGLEAEDLLFDAARERGALHGYAVVTMNDGTVHRLEVEAETDGHYPVTVSGFNTGFLVAKADVDKVLAPASSLEITPPEPEVEETPEETSPAQPDTADNAKSMEGAGEHASAAPVVAEGAGETDEEPAAEEAEPEP